MAIDYDHLRQYTGGDQALEAEVLGLFLETGRGALAEMRGSLDGPGWKPAAHRLKGAALAVGAWSLAELARRAEEAELTTAERADLLSDLETGLSAIQAAVQCSG